MDALPPERIRELRSLIDGVLRDQQVYGQIRNVMSDWAHDADPALSTQPDALLDVVRERGIIDSVLDSLPAGDAAPSRRGAAPPHPRRRGGGVLPRRDPGQRFLHCQLLGGRAFVEHLDADPAQPARESVVVCAAFGRQRFRSQPAAAVVDPPLADDWLIDLDEELACRPELRGCGGEGSPEELLRLDTKLHVVVLRIDPDRGAARYIGENAVDWRSVLRQGGYAVEVPVGPASVPRGLLTLQLELVPAPSPLSAVPDDELHRQRAAEATEQQAATREFWAYARRWWQEFHQISPAFERRNVKVYAEVSGATQQKVPVMALVNPLRCPRVLDSPFEAGRFVSLLAYDQDDDRRTDPGAVAHPGAGAEGAGAWTAPFALVCRGRGSAEERAPLLCSLLAGFGLDAWVALGTDKDDARAAWVLTRTRAQPAGEFSVTFWDLNTGVRHHAAGPPDGLSPPRAGGAAQHRFRELHCAFKYLGFVASVARDASVDAASYDFGDERHWKEMSPIKLRLPRPLPYPPLLPPAERRLGEVEEATEAWLIDAISRHRASLSLPTEWDQQQGYIMTQYLWKCEMERLTQPAQGLAIPAFESVLRSSIPDSFTITCFTPHFAHRSASRMFAHCVQHRQTREQVVELRADVVRLTIRAKAFAYAEDAVSVWLMLAAVSRTPQR